MSEILITGMEMLPEGFAYDVRIKGNGDVVDRQTGVVMGKAIEVPAHGDLIDRDNLAKQTKINICKTGDDYDDMWKAIYDAPTIIEASTKGTEEREC